MHGLPDGIEACLFDLDGVLTKTARVHAAAWKSTFDDCLAGHGAALRAHGADVVVADLAELLDRP